MDSWAEFICVHSNVPVCFLGCRVLEHALLRLLWLFLPNFVDSWAEVCVAALMFMFVSCTADYLEHALLLPEFVDPSSETCVAALATTR